MEKTNIDYLMNVIKSYLNGETSSKGSMIQWFCIMILIL